MSENVAEKTNEFEKIDLVSFASDFLHRFRRLWLLVLILTLVSTALFYYRTTTNYTPTYVAEATVSVEIVNGGAYANRNTAEQMGLIFPYILTSGALSDVIATDLGLNSVPGTIKVSSIKGTNLLTITVTSWNANYAYDTLQSVLRNYPEVAQFVVGQTELTIIDDSGIPEDSGRESVIRGSIKRGAVIGFGLGLLVVVLNALTFRTIRNENELRSLLNIPCLGTLPFYQKKQRRNSTRTEINILHDAENSDYVEAIRLTRTRLERQMEGKQVLMVTSSISGEGKSTVAANLAIAMARKGKRVILVDCDLRNPSVAQIFGLEEQFPGLVSLLRGKCTLQDTLYEVKDHGTPFGLTRLPGGQREARLVEILSSDEMRRVIDSLRQQADVVILDTPPSAMLVDASMLVRYVDAVAYVIMSDYARRRYIFEGVEELNTLGAPIVGCILNGGRTRGGRYGYYGYYGYRRYGYGSYGYGAKAYSAKAYGEEKKSSKRAERKASKTEHKSSSKKKSTDD
ncbi:MAG: polysaccharide biosynthesis tyrosine autokinase [Oscillospiraceae bacterium]|nr:polysaccharide biosynthesis tyrosine autokinase [Oscillospiraceae bacterium]